MALNRFCNGFSKICPKFASTSILLASADTVSLPQCINWQDYFSTWCWLIRWIILNFEYRSDTFFGFPCGVVSCSICPPLRMGIKFWNGQYNIFKNTTYPQKEISFQSSKTFHPSYIYKGGKNEMNVTGAELYFFTNEIEYFRLLNIFLFILLFYYFYFIFLSPARLLAGLFWERVVWCQKCFEESDIWLPHCHRNMICEMRMSHWIRPGNRVWGLYQEKINWDGTAEKIRRKILVPSSEIDEQSCEQI